MNKKTVAVVSLTALALGLGGTAFAQGKKADKKMSFFVTSAGSGNGANLGGLAGADKLCQSMGDSTGVKHVWHAYLSASAQSGQKEVNARDRIGKGPWYNYKGEKIASSVDDLHDNAKINKQTALTEKGDMVKVRGDTPNMHDILTGSDSQGRAFLGADDTTCGNWTSSSTGSAMLGHVDRQGTSNTPPGRSWVMAHPSRGCSQDNLRSTGGGGLLYCFAAK